jgi:FkbM family methyltransferase
MYYSQIGQDKWVHSVLGDKKDGFFVEIGAGDGIKISNTYFFEKNLGWHGICVDANDDFMLDLRKNRNCDVIGTLVYSETDKELEFAVSEITSGIYNEYIGPFTATNKIVKKKTVTLLDILDFFEVPSIIDYLSLDVEGNEYNILKNFSFNKYKFRCLTVAHNEPHVGSKNRMEIRNLLENNGYTFVKGNDNVNNWNHDSIEDFYVYNENI